MELMINQDIRKYKAKDIGNFSFKEAGFIAGGLACAYGCYALQGLAGAEKINIELCILPMIPWLLFGFFKPQGMTFYMFLKTVVYELVLTPKLYPYESDFQIDFDDFEETYGSDYKVQDEYIAELKEVYNETNVTVYKDKKVLQDYQKRIILEEKIKK